MRIGDYAIGYQGNDETAQCGSDLIVDICSAGKSIHTTDIRKHTAREILQLLDNADWACSTYEETYYQAVCAIKSKFGLEG